MMSRRMWICVVSSCEGGSGIGGFLSNEVGRSVCECEGDCAQKELEIFEKCVYVMCVSV